MDPGLGTRTVLPRLNLESILGSPSARLVSSRRLRSAIHLILHGSLSRTERPSPNNTNTSTNANNYQQQPQPASHRNVMLWHLISPSLSLLSFSHPAHRHPAYDKSLPGQHDQGFIRPPACGWAGPLAHTQSSTAAYVWPVIPGHGNFGECRGFGSVLTPSCAV